MLLINRKNGDYSSQIHLSVPLVRRRHGDLIVISPRNVPVPRQRHHQHHDALQLQLTDSILKYYVANATLYFYIRGADHYPLSDVHMDVYKIVRPATGATEPVLKPIWSKKQPQQYGRGEWIQLDFSETISEWFKLRSDNYGFVINATVNGKKVLITDVVGKVSTFIRTRLILSQTRPQMPNYRNNCCLLFFVSIGDKSRSCCDTRVDVRPISEHQTSRDPK